MLGEGFLQVGDRNMKQENEHSTAEANPPHQGKVRLSRKIVRPSTRRCCIYGLVTRVPALKRERL